ncbi:LuxR C-terminal-related transcriptional regulator [Spirillospora sp. NPDC047279]|uniref:ATP-binding protein n=1 Tax=Spirillospora sp. NPDC047279 TaxID=3155478 RepID=UPI0033E55394
MTRLAVERRPGNLPAEVTTFVGRRHELLEVRAALERSRLVTLCGPGGVGKTRLALRVAADLCRAFDDGLWLAELSALHEPALLSRRVADALRLPDLSAGDPLSLLAEHLADRRLLLILDTCEHLPDECAKLAEVLLRAAPGLRVITTTREPLDVLGEHVVRIPPLPAPEPGSPGAATSDASALFVDRAGLVVPGLTPATLDTGTVGHLCHRLDGIPLAIELAAVRLRTMSLDQIMERLDDRFRLLGAARGRHDRQQTLRATVEWSHDLCGPEERLLWARLAVFPGGFDIPAAEAVCTDDDLPADWLADTLGRLVDKSIVQYERETGRYAMLDTIREFGAERLDTRGDHAALRHRHRDHYLSLARDAFDHSLGTEQIVWLDRLRREHHNLRVALDYSLSTPGEEGTGLDMARVLQHYWVFRGAFGEGRDWLRRGLAAYDTPDTIRCRGLLVSAIMHSLVAETGLARTFIDEAAPFVARAGDADLTAQSLLAEGLLAYCAGDEQAGPLLEAAIEAFERNGYREVYSLAAHPHLATIRLYDGDIPGTLRACDEGLHTCDRTGDRLVRQFVQMCQSLTLLLSGDIEGAAAGAYEAIPASADSGELLATAVALDTYAAALTAQGDPFRAAVLMSATDRYWALIRSPMLGPSYADLRNTSREAAFAPLAPADRSAAEARGSAMTPAEALAEARREPAVPSPRPEAPAGAQLSRRELQVAALVAEGLSNREIADRLVIAKRTADSHLEHILAKLGFTSRAQIAAWHERHP